LATSFENENTIKIWDLRKLEKEIKEINVNKEVGSF
jgi:hypothetical protein